MKIFIAPQTVISTKRQLVYSFRIANKLAQRLINLNFVFAKKMEDGFRKHVERK